MTDLKSIAQAAHVTQDEQGKPVVQIPLALWEELLEQLEPLVTPQKTSDEVESDEAPPGTLAALAVSALKLGLSSESVDTAERSREILKAEFADYITRKMRGQNDNDDPD